jgi:hypothetical protein
VLPLLIDERDCARDHLTNCLLTGQGGRNEGLMAAEATSRYGWNSDLLIHTIPGIDRFVLSANCVGVDVRVSVWIALSTRESFRRGVGLALPLGGNLSLHLCGKCLRQLVQDSEFGVTMYREAGRVGLRGKLASGRMTNPISCSSLRAFEMAFGS